MARDSIRRRGRSLVPGAAFSPAGDCSRWNSSWLPSTTTPASTRRKPACTEPVTSRSRSRLGELPRGENLCEPVNFGLVLASDQHAVLSGDGIKFIADALTLPLKRSTDSTRK